MDTSFGAYEPELTITVQKDLLLYRVRTDFEDYIVFAVGVLLPSVITCVLDVDTTQGKQNTSSKAHNKL